MGAGSCGSSWSSQDPVQVQVMVFLVGLVISLSAPTGATHRLALDPELLMEWMLLLPAALEWLPKVDVPLVLKWPLFLHWLLPLRQAPQDMQVLRLEPALLPGWGWSCDTKKDHPLDCLSVCPPKTDHSLSLPEKRQLRTQHRTSSQPAVLQMGGLRPDLAPDPKSVIRGPPWVFRSGPSA